MSIGEITGIELQPRDFELLRGLFESRVMTLKHIAALYFDGKREMAKKRVQKLKTAGLIRERPKHLPTDPSIHFLSKRAFELLRDKGHLADYPKIGLVDLERRAQVSNQTLRHELEVVDVKTAMMTAINAASNFHIAEFSTWPVLYEFKACRVDGEHVTMKPDGFIRVHEKESDGELAEHAFFLEVDLGTETQERLVDKCECYRCYYREGGFSVFCGGVRDDFKSYPFRVFVICRSEERRNNLAQRLSETRPPFSTMVLISTVADCLLNPIKEIWIKPIVLRKTQHSQTEEAQLRRTLSRDSFCEPW